MLTRWIALTVSVITVAPGFAAEPTIEQTEFFEKKVRPVLVEFCYKCHSDQGKQPKGGLRVDGRDRLLTGGDSGPSLVPGDLAKSKFLEAIRYENPDLLMPPKGKLPATAIRDLETWVKAGAPWPNDGGTQTEKPKEFDLAARMKTHWSWQPVHPQSPPTVKNAAWVRDPVDAFILAKLDAKGLTPAAPADKAMWLRRVTFAITGLPPTSTELTAFLADDSPTTFEKVADRLLASPAYGERWGRHWLDLVRYAETRGHEFEPFIPNAHQYRDYVIRALNANVPYDRFVQEQVAGDLLRKPRIDEKTGTNESVIGPAFWHLGEEVHSPVDIRQDQADRLDNRIDVLTKSFLGLTVACARCHDHKFDAIPTKDYYALYGLLEGSSFRQVRFDGWKQNRDVAEDLDVLRREIRQKVWQILPKQDLKLTAEEEKFEKRYQEWQAKALKVANDSYSDGLKDEWQDWFPDDVTFGPRPRPRGSVSLRTVNGKPTIHIEERPAAVFDRFWAGLKNAPDAVNDFGALGRLPRAGFTIRTRNFPVEKKNLYYLVRGGGMAYAGVCNHTIIAGPLHGGLVTSFKDEPKYRWVSQNVSGYIGQTMHVEFTADPKTDFAIAEVVQADEPPPGPPRLPQEFGEPDSAELAKIAEELATAEQKLAKRVQWESRLVPSLLDANEVRERVFVRGNPRSPGEPVVPRILEAFHAPNLVTNPRESGRLRFAEQLTNPTLNPYISRVAVNRVWHQLFGRGIVASTDNFGVLGELPTHPELLDYLATEFVREGWNQKQLIRRLVLSATYRMSSDGTTTDADPSNLLLHRFRLKRLEGEAIRDAMLAISGRLDPKLGGPPVFIHLTQFLEGRGRPASGPIDGAGRRSVYLAVRRNFLSPFLQAFDTPIPFSTVGRRQVSNVPAQALILLNDPFVHQMSAEWAKRVMKEPGSFDEKIRGMYVGAFARPPTDDELAGCRDFVAGKEADVTAWTDLAHTLFNVKEFVFVK